MNSLHPIHVYSNGGLDNSAVHGTGPFPLFILFFLFIGLKFTFDFMCGKISSRTLHTPWDDAGCLCPVGDFFNYAAPEEESFCSEDEMHMGGVSSNCSSLRAEISTEKSNDEQLDCNSQRLTDGGYEEDVAAYCFYARRNYKKGEQVCAKFS